MKLVFFGTPDIAVPILETLHSISEFEIISVFTQPDKPSGRKKIITSSPVKIAAKKLGLKIFQPHSKKELIESTKNIEADFFIVIAYGLIFPEEVLEIPKFGAINIHFSLLPKYRGASPIQESILNGDKETGISIIKIDKDLDHGPIFLAKRLKIEDNDTYSTLSKKQSILSANILPLVLEDIVKGNLYPIKQDHSKASFCKKIIKENGKINWNKKTSEIKNMIRAYQKWPTAYTEFKGKILKILEAEELISSHDYSPGKFLIENKILKISAINGYIIPKRVQLEGKTEMDIHAFINGYGNLIQSKS